MHYIQGITSVRADFWNGSTNLETKEEYVGFENNLYVIQEHNARI
jgi:hypothetical protein